MNAQEQVEKLENEYAYKTSVDFDGNDEVEAFYGHVVGFSLGFEDTIFVTLRDDKGNDVEVKWKEIENNEFDSDE